MSNATPDLSADQGKRQWKSLSYVLITPTRNEPKSAERQFNQLSNRHFHLSNRYLLVVGQRMEQTISSAGIKRQGKHHLHSSLLLCKSHTHDEV
jgi:hypothetical protein